jgi:LacI family transcriptional regulator
VSSHATIKDIAARLGVAHSTVSRALNDHPHVKDETKLRVRRAAADLGYIANSGARLMRLGRSSVIGLIVPDVENPFYSAAAKVMAESCAAEGFQLLLAVSEDDPFQEQNHVQALREARAAGVAIALTANPRRQTIALLRQVPTVQLVRRDSALPCDAVGIDDRAGTRLSTQHLLDLGHRRIAFIGVLQELSTGSARVAGYRAALREAKVKLDPALEKFGRPRPDFGHQALAELLALSDRPTAVVLGSSQFTLGALDAMGAAEVSMPIDLSLVGYGDPDWFRLWRPAITTIGLPLKDIAATAASLLFRRIREPSVDAISRSALHAPFLPTLIVRGSSAKRWQPPD